MVGRGRLVGRSVDPQLGPNTLFKRCTQSGRQAAFSLSLSLSLSLSFFLLLVNTSLLRSGGSGRLAICLHSTSSSSPSPSFAVIPPYSSRIITLVSQSVSQSDAITPPPGPVSTYSSRDKLSFSGLDRNKPTDECPAEHIFAALYALLRPSLPLMIFSQRFPCGKAGYGREREREGELITPPQRPTESAAILSFLPPLARPLDLSPSLPPSWTDPTGEILWPIPGGSRSRAEQSKAVLLLPRVN